MLRNYLNQEFVQEVEELATKAATEALDVLKRWARLGGSDAAKAAIVGRATQLVAGAYAQGEAWSGMDPTKYAEAMQGEIARAALAGAIMHAAGLSPDDIAAMTNKPG